MYKLKVLCLVLSVLALNVQAEAKQPSRFELMDINEDKFVDYNEFSMANPNFTKTAYDIIDSDKDNKVSLEEWNNFMHKHSSPEGMKLDVEKRTKLEAKERPDPPKNPTMPSMPSMTSPSSPKNSTPSMPTTKEFKKQEDITRPSVQTPKRSLPVLQAKELKNPQIQKPKEPTIAPISEPQALELKN